MSKLTLAREVVSLIHHVELGRAGWCHRAQVRLVLACLWLADSPQMIEQVGNMVREEFGATLDSETAEGILRSLCESGEVRECVEGKFEVTAAHRESINRQIGEMEADDDAAKKEFTEILRSRASSLEASRAWDIFNKNLLLPLIRNTGANIYSLITGAAPVGNEVTYEQYLEGLDRETRGAVQGVAQQFLDPSNRHARAYVLRTLNAYLLVEAIGLDKTTLESLNVLANRKVEFDLFVDTNFLFLMLDLDSVATCEVANSLVNLVKQISPHVTVRFKVLQETLDEAGRVIRPAFLETSDYHLTKNLAKQLLQSNVRGLERRFIEESLKSGCKLSAAEYFKPYVSNLLMVLRQRGISVWGKRLDGLSSTREVQEEIEEHSRFLQGKLTSPPKLREPIVHDVTLWHHVAGLRQFPTQSPLDARYWILTMDYKGLRAYDKMKQGKARSQVAICITPSELVQMLQFWVPRSAILEEAALCSLRLPFFFEVFDEVAEKITQKILKTLGRFEGVGDLDEQTIIAIKMDERLRSQLSQAKDQSREVELVKEAVVQELAERDKRVADLQRDAKVRDESIQQMEVKLAVEAGKRERRERELAQEKADEHAELTATVHGLERDLSEAKAGGERHTFVMRWVVGLGFTCALVYTMVVTTLLWLTSLGILDVVLLVSIPLLAIYIAVVDARGRRLESVKRSKAYLALLNIKRPLYWILALAFSTILSEMLTGWFKLLKAKLGL